MPGFEDSAVIVLLALLLFGPKKLPVLARQLGKLMGDFRRASSEFRTQMEEELRISEQADRQKQIAALEAVAPPAAIAESIPEPEHPHLPPPMYPPEPPSRYTYPDIGPQTESATVDPAPATPLPIATSGELSILPPSTGLPIANSSPAPAAEPHPEANQPNPPAPLAELETETLHG